LWPERQQIDAERGHVDRHRTDRLHGVGVEEHAVLVGETRQLGDGLERTRDVVGGHDAGETRIGTEGRFVLVQVGHAVTVDRHVRHVPVQPLQVPGRLHDRGMLHGADDHAARLELLQHAQEGEVVRLRAAAGEHYLLLPRAQHGRHLGARLRRRCGLTAECESRTGCRSAR
jgi:hypothetical protein